MSDNLKKSVELTVFLLGAFQRGLDDLLERADGVLNKIAGFEDYSFEDNNDLMIEVIDVEPNRNFVKLRISGDIIDWSGADRYVWEDGDFKKVKCKK